MWFWYSNLEADKKSDPDVLARLQGQRSEVEQKKAKVSIQAIKCHLVTRHSIQLFTDKNYDPNVQAALKTAANKATIAAQKATANQTV